MNRFGTKKGFSLLELILALGIGSAIALIKFQDMKIQQEDLVAKTAGDQIKQLGEAVNGYISMRYDKLSTLTSSSNQSSDPGPRTCDSTGCEIDYHTLVNEGLLPASYNGNNIYKSPYKIILKREGTVPNYVINGLITTSSAWIEGGHIRYDLLGKAMQVAGVDSGITKDSTSVAGFQSQWNEKNTTFNNITRDGLLAFRVGYNSALYAIYLRRDGTLPMTGNLNMGGQSIYNAQDITAAGTTTTGILKTNAAATVGTTLNVAGVTTLGSDLNVSGNGQINGNLNSNNTVSGTTITSRGETYTQNWFRTLGDGGIYFQKYGGGWNMTDANTIRAYNGKNIATTGAITASGNITGNTITANGEMVSKGRLTASEYVQINGIATAGAACSPNGLQGRDNTGQLLSCTSGKWTAIGSGFFRSPKPQTIQCTARGSYVDWTYQARMDVSGQVYSRKYSDNGDDSGWMTGPSTFVTMNGVTGTASAQSCASHNECSYSTPTCSASWNWNP
ncbi:shufflon system plasmid conjugative transfer pilus tip adhesin PilV [Enterobacter soli]|uniref:shufflon system plasmid conjugative transfer pilus tip adhesin PilV n=1 Tax=Enterobacter soli TaxID=885040 RepID=UPI00237858E5|nr:shufflon system plasmid conjugative transfer pilus tip adhesin PilV [Enterobacter soli]MDD9245346.1 shufflon system plasmid conjugative transfer pilus tip adhesin PilV [Enterobacter soli]